MLLPVFDMGFLEFYLSRDSKRGKILNQEKLRELLTSVQNEDYQIPKGYTAYDLAAIMVEHLGDTDPELRDDLCYGTLSEWHDRKFLSAEDVRRLLHVLLDERHLLLGLGRFDDTVFMRSFSALVVSLGICRHAEEPFLRPDEVTNAWERMLRFYENDADVRGYVEGKGWAHGAAHGADALDELARCQELDASHLKRILEALRSKTMTGRYSYVHQEDERMVTPVTAVLERGVLDEEWLAQWVSGFENMTRTGEVPHDMVLRVNVKQFLRSLVYRLQKPEHAGKRGAGRIVAEALTVLKHMDRF